VISFSEPEQFLQMPSTTRKKKPSSNIPINNASRNRKRPVCSQALSPKGTTVHKTQITTLHLLLCVGPATICSFQVCALLSVHSGFDFLKLTLTSQQFLSLFVDLPLDLDLDFSELLFLTSELLFLETNRLGCQILRVHGGITVFPVSF
jgi:hypothetical protein